MNWQKLNEVETYTHLWEKFKGLFHRKKADKELSDINKEDNSLDDVYESFSDRDDSDNLKQINLVKIAKACGRHWYLFIIWSVIAFAIACCFVLPIPRYYSSTVKLAPELSNMMGSGSLSSIAEQFGIDLGSSKLDGGDAILPELYPDLIESVDFQTGLFPINVVSLKGDVNTSYFDYLAHMQKYSWWQKILNNLSKEIAEKLDPTTSNSNNASDNQVNPFKLTKEQNDVCRAIDGKVKCSVDKKNYVISISVEDQDPLISATIADSVKVHLQKFITKYRTQKAQNDLDYTLHLQEDAKKRYESARREYAEYSDTHQDMALQEYQSKQEDLENEMQLRYNSYSALATQVQAARAKLREQTPAFTTLQSATVPVKPAGPKRMIIIAAILFMTIVIVTIYSAAYEESQAHKKIIKKKAAKEPEERHE